MLTIRGRRMVLIAFIAFAFGAVISLYCLSTPKEADINPNPAQIYDYYYIYAEEDGRELMRVPLAVNIDDELITEDNKRYKVIKVDGDKGIARYVEDVNIERYKPE